MATGDTDKLLAKLRQLYGFRTQLTDVVYTENQLLIRDTFSVQRLPDFSHKGTGGHPEGTPKPRIPALREVRLPVRKLPDCSVQRSSSPQYLRNSPPCAKRRRSPASARIVSARTGPTPGRVAAAGIRMRVEPHRHLGLEVCALFALELVVLQQQPKHPHCLGVSPFAR